MDYLNESFSQRKSSSIFESIFKNNSLITDINFQNIYWRLQDGFLSKNFILCCITTIIITILISYIFKPLNLVKDLKAVGWDFLIKETRNGKTLTEAINHVQKLRKTGKLPPVYPNGWFPLAETRFIEKQKVKSVRALGETFAIFRGENSEIHILDAYCPHLGANLAVGGIVKGNCLECPFHGWQFDGKDGKCTKIPYAEKVPDSVKIKRWESRERNGFIYVWYDAEGRPPSYEIPVIEEIENGSWIYRGRTEHEILAHIQEIPENGADLAHLGHVHVPNVLKGSDLNAAFKSNRILDWVSHSWGGHWQSCEAPNNHIANLEVHHSWSIFGGKFNLFKTNVTVQQIGPSVVFLLFDTFLGKGMLIQNVTPVEALKQYVVHHFYSSAMFVTPIAKMVLRIEAAHFERDIMVWNNKQFLHKPFLVKEDKFINKYRRWYSQFYSENSPKMQSFQKEGLDW